VSQQVQGVVQRHSDNERSTVVVALTDGRGDGGFGQGRRAVLYHGDSAAR
jgi:Mg-chelatase subunit ChlD